MVGFKSVAKRCRGSNPRPATRVPERPLTRTYASGAVPARSRCIWRCPAFCGGLLHMAGNEDTESALAATVCASWAEARGWTVPGRPKHMIEPVLGWLMGALDVIDATVVTPPGRPPATKPNVSLLSKLAMRLRLDLDSGPLPVNGHLSPGRCGPALRPVHLIDRALS